jgi:hypothetical protein
MILQKIQVAVDIFIVALEVVEVVVVLIRDLAGS